jgi:hypothetical protein
MANDVATPSNPPVAPIEEEKLEKTPFDVNVSQRSQVYCRNPSFKLTTKARAYKGAS